MTDRAMMDDALFAEYACQEGRADPKQPAPAPTPRPVPPEMEAVQQMLSEALSREMVLRAEIIRMRRQAAS